MYLGALGKIHTSSHLTLVILSAQASLRTYHPDVCSITAETLEMVLISQCSNVLSSGR